MSLSLSNCLEIVLDLCSSATYIPAFVADDLGKTPQRTCREIRKELTGWIRNDIYCQLAER
ncbi:MAG: hypothetical protein M0O96_02705, partial [Desulforhopalus sp.]|nr:hypothetical protein [Desulforhopalus sp.]